MPATTTVGCIKITGCLSDVGGQTIPRGGNPRSDLH